MPAREAETPAVVEAQHPFVVLEGSRLAADRLGDRVHQARQHDQDHQAHAGAAVDAPVHQRQQDEVELLVAEEGQSLEDPVQGGAELLEPEDDVDSPVENGFHPGPFVCARVTAGAFPVPSPG